MQRFVIFFCFIFEISLAENGWVQIWERLLWVGRICMTQVCCVVSSGMCFSSAVRRITGLLYTLSVPAGQPVEYRNALQVQMEQQVRGTFYCHPSHNCFKERNYSSFSAVFRNAFLERVFCACKIYHFRVFDIFFNPYTVKSPWIDTLFYPPRENYPAGSKTRHDRFPINQSIDRSRLDRLYGGGANP